MSRAGISAAHKMIALLDGAKPPQGALAVVQRSGGFSDLIGFVYEVEGGVRVDWPDCEGHVWPGAKIVGVIIGVIGDAAAALGSNEPSADEWAGFNVTDI